MYEVKDKQGKVIAKFGSEDEALWTNAVEKTENEIKELEHALKINQVVLESFKSKLKESKKNDES